MSRQLRRFEKLERSVANYCRQEVYDVLQGLGVLKTSAALKIKAVKEGAFKLLSALAYKYQQLDVVCGALVDLLNKQEHVPQVLAELADFALVRHGDARLVLNSY